MLLTFLLVHPCPSLPYFCVTFSQFSLFSYPEDGGSRLLSQDTKHKGAWCLVPEGNLIDIPYLKSHVVCLLLEVTSQDTVLKSDLLKYMPLDLKN